MAVSFPPFSPPAIRSARPRASPATRPAGRLAYEQTAAALVLLGGLPAVGSLLFLLWFDRYPAFVQALAAVVLGATWLGCAAAARRHVVFPLQTLANLLAALREGDYSLRARSARRDDALGEVMREVNELGVTLLTQRQQATESHALLRAVMAEIEPAVFTFDDAERLRLVNRAATRLLGRTEEELLGQSAAALGLPDLLGGEPARTFSRDFGAATASGPGAGAVSSTTPRWGLRRVSFRQEGRPHQLVVLTDLSQALREEERAAWQRLIRVLGHELNNSLAPICSIADSLQTLLRRQPEVEDCREDLESGLGLIASRADALNRFMKAYAALARLPAPTRQPQPVGPLVQRVVALTALPSVRVDPGPALTADLDADQIEQVLINLVRNAVDAVRETGGAVVVHWQSAPGGWLEISVEDEGPGLPPTANLFVPFFTTKPHGSGIGLVLSRQIAEAHGGVLSLAGRPDGHRGCRALLRLPGSAPATG